MKIFLIVLTITSLILLLPIPLKITLSYSGKKAHIKIYNKEINITKRVKKKIKKTTVKVTDKIEEDVIHKDFFNPHNIKKILKILKRNKFKFNYKSNISITYSLEDAAHTAIMYGFLNQLLSYLHGFLAMFLNVKDYKYNINPQYNKYYLNFEITSIVFVNLGKLIYICIIILHALKFGPKKLKLPKVQYKEEMQNG
ncbi:DUF2953 domain-containing protein [Clostridium sp.]|uniref:DUF2953 domain-containing protein n=1 Tax=Clostridium sp. TaxID=1506 RepID=UPI002FC68F03